MSSWKRMMPFGSIEKIEKIARRETRYPRNVFSSSITFRKFHFPLQLILIKIWNRISKRPVPFNKFMLINFSFRFTTSRHLYVPGNRPRLILCPSQRFTGKKAQDHMYHRAITTVVIDHVQNLFLPPSFLSQSESRMRTWPADLVGSSTPILFLCLRAFDEIFDN